jgi:3-dehydroquinate synthase
LVRNALGSYNLVEIKSGEEFKTLESSIKIWEHLTDHHFERRSLLVNLGGGVIGDMGGFCAATYKRGIDFINIPTTLLAQVDASIGGKLAIDFLGLKNHIGVFKKPRKVLIDTVFLKTLSEMELRSGFAEVIKHCLITDAPYWEDISSRSFKDQPWDEIVQHSVNVKNRIVEDDPHEIGLRKILNYGHTIGHAIESYFLHNKKNRILHGEAVAAGMICEAYLSESKCGLAKKAVSDIENYILQTYGKIQMDEDEMDAIVVLCQQDKKNERGIINFSLLEKIGKSIFNVVVEQNDIRKALQNYASL